MVRPGPIAGWLGKDSAQSTASPQPAEPSPLPVLAAASTSAPQPAAAGLRTALDPLIEGSALGKRVNVSVVDLATGASLYDRRGDVPTVPASVTKLVTGVAVLAARGPAYRITTRVVAGRTPGEVVIIGGGDPTLAIDEDGFYPDAGRLDLLAKQVKATLGATAPTKVTVDSSLYQGPVHEPGWDEDIPTGGYGAAATALATDGARINPDAKPQTAAERFREPDLAAGRAFAKLLGVPTANVAKGKAPAGGTTASPGGTSPAPGAELGKVESPPVIRLVDIMISSSDNVIAEALARQVALARDQPASFIGAGKAVNEVATELGLPADQLAVHDGSGLSRTNRISPSFLTRLLVLAGNGSRPELAGIFTGLPVGGWSGTLKDRYGSDDSGADGAGVVRAKTGTLTGVHAISGLVTTADGRLLAFAFLSDGVQVGSPQAQPALDRIAAKLASCGCR